MHGAGNDFVVIDATSQNISLSKAQLQYLGHRQRGIGADQILLVEKSKKPGMDFYYRIFNGQTGEEVEQCGNGARCFGRYVYEQKLTPKKTIHVETINTDLTLELKDDGTVSVDMGRPVFEAAQLPFDAQNLLPRSFNGFSLWPLRLNHDHDDVYEVALVSMGNPHAVLRVENVDQALVESIGESLQQSKRFPQQVNVGFMEIVSRSQIRLRVYERGAGETLACGTGACAAVVAGIRLGWLDSEVEVHTLGGILTIVWHGNQDTVKMSGPATTVFEGIIELETQKF
jgi:diaminopimelate epimerase